MTMQSRRGGTFVGVLIGLVVVLGLVIIGAIYVASNVHVRNQRTASGEHVRFETPLGEMNIDTRDNLKPESIGVPVYPGAEREHGKSGGVLFNLDLKGQEPKEISVVAAEYSTDDSAQQVREFYREHLPNWTISEKEGRDLKMEYTAEGYKRIIVINEKHGRTHIGIASTGEPAVN